MGKKSRLKPLLQSAPTGRSYSSSSASTTRLSFSLSVKALLFSGIRVMPLLLCLSDSSAFLRSLRMLGLNAQKQLIQRSAVEVGHNDADIDHFVISGNESRGFDVDESEQPVVRCLRRPQRRLRVRCRSEHEDKAGNQDSIA